MINMGQSLLARNWWLRSPNSNSNNERNVNTSGVVNNNNVTNTNGVVPDCGESEIQVSPTGAESKASAQGGTVPSRKRENDNG